MKLPELTQPERYGGLYVFDFGEWSAVGYTAEEVAILLEDPRYADGHVYRIRRATPDGRFELQGVSNERFQLESGMLFYFEDEDAARDAFARLASAADDRPPPCRAVWHRVDRGPQTALGRHALALLFPAEYEEDIGHWLLELDYMAGDMVEGGVSVATGYYNEQPLIVERKQLWSAKSEQSRSASEVLNSVRRAVQR